MWNIIYSNSNCNNWNRLKEHKGHLERLVYIKKSIDNKMPKQPKFLKEKVCKKELQRELNREIDKDNIILYKKIYDVKNHPSPYSKLINIPSKCPAFESLYYNTLIKYKNIEKENEMLKHIFISAKPVINTRKLLDEYNYYKYLKKNISKKAIDRNPNLNFSSYDRFKKKLLFNIEKIQNNDNNIFNKNLSFSYRSKSMNNIKNNNIITKNNDSVNKKKNENKIYYNNNIHRSIDNITTNDYTNSKS